jgi:hypothetical protein
MHACMPGRANSALAARKKSSFPFRLQNVVVVVQ